MSAGFTNQDTMVSARNMVPWHGLGTVVEKLDTWEEAYRLSGIRPATLEPVYYRNEDGLIVPIPDRRAVMVPGVPEPLQVVSDRYRVLDPKDAFAFADGIVGTGDGTYETTGTLKGQRLYWLLIRLSDEIRLGQDKLNEYLFVRDARDGTSAVKASLIHTRVVCQNTWAAGDAEGGAISIRHTEGIKDRLEEAGRVLGVARSKMASEKALLEALAAAEVTLAEAKTFYANLLPIPEKPKEKAKLEGWEVSREHVVRDREVLLTLFQDGKGATLAGKTYWGLFNGVTDFVDHQRQPGAAQESVMFSSLLGQGAKLKGQALKLATLAIA